MARKERKNRSEERAPSSSFDKAGWRIVAFFAFAIPLFVSPTGKDSFRLPKDVLFRAEGILLIALFVLALVWNRLSLREIRWRNPVVVIPIAAVLWTLVATALSTSRTISLRSLPTVLFAAAIFIGTTAVLRRRDERAFMPLLAASAINGVVYLLQVLGIWNPFGMTSAFVGHRSSSGFLGNANDVGSALMGPLLAAVAVALATPRRRMMHSVLAALLLATILASRSITALLAIGVALAIMAVVRFGRRALLTLAAIAVVSAALLLIVPPLRARLNGLQQLVANHDYDRLLSGRTSSFRAATQMFVDHPVIGIGPGTFGWHYMPYKLRLGGQSPGGPPAGASSRFNFEEAHNDHLEVLAETGLPGYAILLAALGLLAARSWRGKEDAEQQRATTHVTARLLALPLAGGFFVLALAQYPLQLASATATLIFLTAACFAWSGDEVS